MQIHRLGNFEAIIFFLKRINLEIKPTEVRTVLKKSYVQMYKFVL